jgi:hypothetical protein
MTEKSHFERWCDIISKTPSGHPSKDDRMASERRAFQEWYEADAMPLEHSNWFRVDVDGDYEIDTVRWAWIGWKARASI